MTNQAARKGLGIIASPGIWIRLGLPGLLAIRACNLSSSGLHESIRGMMLATGFDQSTRHREIEEPAGPDGQRTQGPSCLLFGSGFGVGRAAFSSDL